MEWLNYHHLLYFWMVVRTGSVAAASTELKLASPTISVQIRRLEEQLGEKLLRRSGRHVIPTEMGQIVYRYADEIFALGRELLDTARGRPTGRPMHVVIGVHDVIPKAIARRLIEPALKLPDPVRITCREGSSEQLLAELSVQRVDVVLADAPISPTVKVRAYNHLLGETGLSFLGVPRLGAEVPAGFPEIAARRADADCPPRTPQCGTPWTSGSTLSTSGPASSVSSTIRSYAGSSARPESEYSRLHSCSRRISAGSTTCSGSAGCRPYSRPSTRSR